MIVVINNNRDLMRRRWVRLRAEALRRQQCCYRLEYPLSPVTAQSVETDVLSSLLCQSRVSSWDPAGSDVAAGTAAGPCHEGSRSLAGEPGLTLSGEKQKHVQSYSSSAESYLCLEVCAGK